jgi:hypothetical protein
VKQTRGVTLAIIFAGLICLGAENGVAAATANRNPCIDEVSQFCGEIAPGPAGMNAMMDCLEKHEADLSPACRKFEAGMGSSRMERGEAVREKSKFRNSCLADMTRFCGDIQPTPGGMVNCLNAHAEELSAPCRQSIDALR